MKTSFALCASLLLTTIASGFSETKPEYFSSFDPAKGFKPAQRDLTEVYLQLAASLENFGSPEPYLRPHGERTRSHRGALRGEGREGSEVIPASSSYR